MNIQPTEDNSYNVKLSRYSHQQHRRQSNKSNLSSYSMSSDHEMNCDEECQKRQLLGKDLDVEGKKYNEDEEEEREGVEYKNDCVDGAEANGDIDDIDGVNHVDRNNANDDNNNDDDDDDNDDDNDNPYSIDQQTNHHYSTSFPTLTSDSLSNCISPMLAAAAMAALTTGCFSTSCNQLSQLNYSLLSKSYGISQLSPPPTPLHPPPPPLTLQPPVPPSSSSSSAHTQRSHITKQQQLAFLNSTPNRNSKVSGTHHSHSHHHQHNNCNNNNVSINSLSSVGCNSSSPIHSIHSNNDGYNTITNNKSNYASTSPPPQLSSRSNSPHQLLNNRLVSSNNLTYLSSMDDVDEENDEMESDEGEEEMEGEEMDNSSAHGNNHQWTFEEQFKQVS